MGVQRFLEAQPSFDIQRYASHDEHRRTGVEFVGTPRRHPYDEERLVLVPSPFDNSRVFYEFRLKDVLHAEEANSIVNDEGNNIQLVRFWIRRGSRALKLSPFEVGAAVRTNPD